MEKRQSSINDVGKTGYSHGKRIKLGPYLTAYTKFNSKWAKDLRIRTKTISKGDFTFCLAQYLNEALANIDKMSENSFDEIVDKYVEMNVAHPFMEGNGRSTRIWLDLILKKRLKKCVDWSKIGKKEYLQAMVESRSDSTKIRKLLKNALTDKIDDREMFMKGIDYSYYYEEAEE